MNFSEIEKQILKIVQNDLPDSLTPYKDIADQVGTNERFVINLLQKLKDNNIIRRFGASIKHQKAGWNHNAMVAWCVLEEEAQNLGKIAASHSNISHCYFRPSDALDWQYTLYTMIHGRNDNECNEVVNELIELGLPNDYAILESEEELKKISMRYFE